MQFVFGSKQPAGDILVAVNFLNPYHITQRHSLCVDQFHPLGV